MDLELQLLLSAICERGRTIKRARIFKFFSAESALDVKFLNALNLMWSRWGLQWAVNEQQQQQQQQQQFFIWPYYEKYNKKYNFRK